MAETSRHEETPRENEPIIEKPSSIGEIVGSLKGAEFNPEECSYEFEVVGEISPSEIKELVELPYEVTLIESKGKVFLSTEREKYVRRETTDRARRESSKFVLHTHSIKVGEGIVNTPSIGDIFIACGEKRATKLLLAHAEGMMVYRKPSINPETGKNIGKNDNVRDIIMNYGKKHGVDVYGFGTALGKKLKPWKDLSQGERIAFERRLAEDTGVIVEEAAWDDAEGIAKIMKYINIKKVKN